MTIKKWQKMKKTWKIDFIYCNQSSFSNIKVDKNQSVQSFWLCAEALQKAEVFTCRIDQFKLQSHIQHSYSFDHMTISYDFRAKKHLYIVKWPKSHQKLTSQNWCPFGHTTVSFDFRAKKHVYMVKMTKKSSKIDFSKLVSVWS